MIRWSVVALVALTVTAPARTTAQSRTVCPEPAVRTVAALEQRVAALEARQKATIAERCEIAQLRLLTGRTDDAAALIKRILQEQPRAVDAMLVLARIYTREQDDSLAAAVLQRALATDRKDVRAGVQWASHVASRRAPAEALPLLEQIVAEHPNDVRALVAMAGVDYRLFRDSAAQQLLDRALALDSMYVPAYVIQSDLYVRALKENERTRVLHRALAIDSVSVEAQLAVSRMQRQRNQVDSAYSRLMAVLSFDPTNLEAHGTLGNGGSIKSWGKYPPLEDNAVPPDLARRLDLGDSLLLTRSFDRADSVFNDVLRTNPGLAAARIGLASIRYYRGNYDAAYRQFLDIARDHPGLGLAHYGLSESVKRIRELRDPRNAEAFARFRALPRPQEPERLREVFTNFDRLDDDLQKIVLLSVAPLSNYIPILALAGGTYHLLPFHHRLWQWQGTAGSRGRRTFDGRLWDDVKGQGGRNAVAGAEWTRETSLERYNVLSHEFMHQVHAELIPAQRVAIDSLYRAARTQRRTLDSYADSNPQEYLAQVYEAFISPIKDPRLGGTSGNTRDRLRELDPAGYAFVEQINAQPSYLPHAVQALQNRTRGRAVNLDALERDADWVLKRYGDHPDLAAVQAAIQVARAQDFARAAATIERGLAIDSTSRAGWLALARYRVYAGDAPAAARALERAAALPAGVGGNAESNLMRAEHARLIGNHSAASDAYARIAAETNNRLYRTRALLELASLTLRTGNVVHADSLLASVRDSSRNDPLTREVQARVLFAQGRAAEALSQLLELRSADQSRLETITELLPIARMQQPDLVANLIADGRALIARRVPVPFQLDAFAPQPGLITARAIAEFEAAAALTRR